MCLSGGSACMFFTLAMGISSAQPWSRESRRDPRVCRAAQSGLSDAIGCSWVGGMCLLQEPAWGRRGGGRAGCPGRSALPSLGLSVPAPPSLASFLQSVSFPHRDQKRQIPARPQGGPKQLRNDHVEAGTRGSGREHHSTFLAGVELCRAPSFCPLVESS